jgi:hypothetical protein
MRRASISFQFEAAKAGKVGVRDPNFHLRLSHSDISIGVDYKGLELTIGFTAPEGRFHSLRGETIPVKVYSPRATPGPFYGLIPNANML